MSTTPTPSDSAAPEAAASEVKSEVSREARPTPVLDKLLGVGGAAPEPEVKSEAPAEVKESKPVEVPPDRREAHEKAIMAIRRAKVPERIWSSLDPESVIEMGTGLAEMQAGSDKLSQELGEFRKSVAAKESDSAAKPSAAKEQPMPDFGENLSRFSEDFPEHAEGLKLALAKAVEIAQSRAQQAMEEKLSTLGLDRMGRDLTNLLMKEARDELGERFPQLADKERSKAVVPIMERLAKTGDYDNIVSLMADASAIAFADDARNLSKSHAATQDHKSRDKGQPTVNGKTKASDGPSLFDRRMARLAEIEQQRR